MNDERIIAYLLDELSPDESARFEEECFEAETWPEEVRLVEDELIEDYLRGELSPARRERFRLNYLTTTARRERVRVATALLRHADETATAEVPEEEKQETAVAATPARPTLWESLRGFWGGHVWAARALAALLFVALAVVVWKLITLPSAPPNSVALTIAASRSERGPGAPPTSVPPLRGDDTLHVTLLLPEGAEPAKQYRVEMEDESGKLTIVEPAVTDARTVKVVVPARQLARGAYVLKLYAVGDRPTQRVGSYFFNVE